MMSHHLLILVSTVVVLAGSLLFSSLTYSLRHFSRAQLADYLERHGKSQWVKPTIDYQPDLTFVTAVGRLMFNLFVFIGVLRLFYDTGLHLWVQYALAVLVTAMLTLFCSVALPQAVATYAAEELVGFFVVPLHGLRRVLTPVTSLMHATDEVVRRASGSSDETEPEEIEQEIMSVVEEGQKEGIVDPEERAMIERVINFRGTTAGQAMTPRSAMVAMDAGSDLAAVKQLVEDTGHSRVPVFEGTLDHIVGVLYARDLIKHLGGAVEHFDIRSAMRAALYVPETKLLRDLLKDFRLQKVHIAIVLDEYGGTAGLVTIEDLLEELVGEISDEHEPKEPAMLARISDVSWEADARVYINELNRVVGLALPEDAGYDTLGGFVSTTLGRIPEAGTSFEFGGTRYTILSAEPQRVNRVRIDLAATASLAEESARQQ